LKFFNKLNRFFKISKAKEIEEDDFTLNKRPKGFETELSHLSISSLMTSIRVTSIRKTS
jgi:hypothetical protein